MSIFSNTTITLQKECDLNLKAFSDMKKKADDMLRERDLERKKSQKQEGKTKKKKHKQTNHSFELIFC